MGSKRKTLQKTVGAQKEAWWKLEAHSSVNEIKINLFIPWLVWSTEVSALRECKKCLGGWLLQMTLGVTVDGAQYWMTRWLAVSRTESGKLDEDSKRSEREGGEKREVKTLGYFKEKGGGMQHFQERAAERLFLKKSRARLRVTRIQSDIKNNSCCVCVNLWSQLTDTSWMYLSRSWCIVVS